MEHAVETLLQFKLVAIGIWLVLMLTFERLAPAVPPPTDEGRYGWRRLMRNGVLWLANTGLSPLVVIPVSVWAAGVDLWATVGWSPRPAWWSGWQGLILDVLLLDLFIYWWHRANHMLPILWRFHEVHHLDQHLDATTAVRFHFGEVLLSALVRASVIVAFGIPLASVLVFETAVLVCALFQHANLRLPVWLERPLNWVIITPRLHWVHHHAIRRDTDSNYGTILSVWDRLFRSRRTTERRSDRRIGVENRPELTLAGLMARPFRGRA